MNEEQKLTPVFMPSLGAVLLAAEDKKGVHLIQEEVLEIRDNATCIMMEELDAAKMAESREYIDIDPENCWYDFQMLRRELGHKPDLDPGARIQLVKSSDPAYQATVTEAQDSLPTFKEMSAGRDPHSLMIKTRLSDAAGHAFVWLLKPESNEDGFVAEIFEVPSPLLDFRVGDKVQVASEDVTDWMINDDGTLYGGFSLRYHRAGLPEHERPAFDEHIGVTKYA